MSCSEQLYPIYRSTSLLFRIDGSFLLPKWFLTCFLYYFLFYVNSFKELFLFCLIPTSLLRYFSKASAKVLLFFLLAKLFCFFFRFLRFFFALLIFVKRIEGFSVVFWLLLLAFFFPFLLSFFPSCFLLLAFFFDLVEEHREGGRMRRGGGRRRGSPDGAYLPAKPQLYINVRANEIGLSAEVLEQEKNASFFSCFFASPFFLCIFAYDYGSIATSLPRKLPIIINDKTIRTEKEKKRKKHNILTYSNIRLSLWCSRNKPSSL